MNINFYLLTASLLTFSFYSNGQNCTTQQLENQSLCSPATYTFQPTSGKIAVYNINDTSVLSIAPEVTVNPSATTSYLYAQTEQIGPADHTIGSGDFYTTVDKYVSFTANHNVLINTMDIYPQNAGTVTIKLVKTAYFGLSQTTIDTRSITVSGGGMQTVPVDFYVPQGTDYRIVLQSETCGGLFRNAAGENFPYTSPSGAINITGGDYDFMGYYYYFYNWNVTPVTCINTLELTVLTPPVAAVLLHQQGLIASEAGMTYQWMNCTTDEVIPGATGQQFTPSEGGNYAVVVSNGACEETSECIAYTGNTTGIEDVGNAGVNVYPNPVENVLTVQAEKSINQIAIQTANGQVVYESGSVAVVDMSFLPSGIYFATIRFEDGTASVVRLIRK